MSESVGKKYLKHYGDNTWEALSKIRKDVMIGLFDLGRLLIADQRRFRAYQDEVESILNNAYDSTKKNIESNLTNVHNEECDEIYFVKRLFGYECRYLPLESWDWTGVYPELHLLMRLMYGEEEIPRADHYLTKAQRIINIAIHKAYGIKENE